VRVPAQVVSPALQRQDMRHGAGRAHLLQPPFLLYFSLLLRLKPKIFLQTQCSPIFEHNIFVHNVGDTGSVMQNFPGIAHDL